MLRINVIKFMNTYVSCYKYGNIFSIFYIFLKLNVIDKLLLSILSF
jgi:hypothetical protein